MNRRGFVRAFAGFVGAALAVFDGTAKAKDLPKLADGPRRRVTVHITAYAEVDDDRYLAPLIAKAIREFASEPEVIGGTIDSGHTVTHMIVNQSVAGNEAFPGYTSVDVRLDWEGNSPRLTSLLASGLPVETKHDHSIRKVESLHEEQARLMAETYIESRQRAAASEVGADPVHAGVPAGLSTG
jgi:hypothetical protein